MVMPFPEIQSLASFLPFAKTFHWLESPIEFEDDFKQRYTYDPFYAYYYPWGPVFQFDLNVMTRHDDVAEKSVVFAVLSVAPCNTQNLSSRSVKYNEEVTTLDVNQVEQRYCCCCDGSTFTRVPSMMTRWSLLTQVILHKSDIVGKASCSSVIHEVSILKSLAVSDYYKRIQPHLDVTLCFLAIPESALRDLSFWVRYSLDYKSDPGSHWFGCHGSGTKTYSNAEFVVEYAEW